MDRRSSRARMELVCNPFHHHIAPTMVMTCRVHIVEVTGLCKV